MAAEGWGIVTHTARICSKYPVHISATLSSILNYGYLSLLSTIYP